MITKSNDSRQSTTQTNCFKIWGLRITLIVLLLGSLGACQPDETNAIRIVASLPLSPDKSGLGWDTAQGMLLAIEEANYQAGDFIVEFELLDASGPDDDILVPEREEANAKKAAADAEVLIYLGNSYSSGCKVGIPILNQAGLAQISPGATYPGLTKQGFAAGEPAIYYPSGERTFFRVVTTDDMQGPAGAFWAQDQGMERVYIVEQEDIYGQGLSRAFNQIAQIIDLNVVGTSTVAEGQNTGLETLVADIAAQQPDLIYYTGFRSGAVPLIQALKQGDVTTSFMGGDGIFTPALIEELGPDAEGIMATFTGLSVDQLDDSEGFTQRYEDRFGTQPGGWSIPGYDAMNIALAAIAQAGQAERATVLNSLRYINHDGLAGHYSFDQNGDTRLLLISGMYVQDGQWHSEGLLRVQ